MYLNASVPRLQLLDVFIVNDELPMLRYRLRLHKPFASRTLIAEGRLTYTGQSKALYAREGPERLTEAEQAEYNVRLLDITYSKLDLQRSNCSHRNCHNVLERRQRVAINSVIFEELAGMDNRTLVFFSDVDELLDLEAVAIIAPGTFRMQQQALPDTGNESSASTLRWCVSPLMAGYQYSQHCPMPHPRWARAVLCSAAWFRHETLAWEAGGYPLELRKLGDRGTARHKVLCPPAVAPKGRRLGHHFSYFFDSAAVLRKVSSFKHADDPGITVLSRAANRSWALEEIERRVKICQDPVGHGHFDNLAAGAKIFPDHRDMPPLTDWPRHPYWQGVDDAHANRAAVSTMVSGVHTVTALVSHL